MNLDHLLDQFVSGKMSREELKRHLARAPFQELDSAKLDHHRLVRTNHPEVVFCQGKTPEQVREIFRAMLKEYSRVLGTRADEEHCRALEDVQGIEYDPVSRLLTCGRTGVGKKGLVAVVSAGTSDLPVAEEAAQTAEYLGSKVFRHYDCGAAGIHRLLSALDEIASAKAIITVAGMEGALATVVSGMVSPPVIAVPTSIGYGASFEGLAALLSMMNCCAPGVSVVNIDNGFGAGYLAHVINAQSR